MQLPLDRFLNSKYAKRNDQNHICCNSCFTSSRKLKLYSKTSVFKPQFDQYVRNMVLLCKVCHDDIIIDAEKTKKKSYLNSYYQLRASNKKFIENKESYLLELEKQPKVYKGRRVLEAV